MAGRVNIGAPKRVNSATSRWTSAADTQGYAKQVEELSGDMTASATGLQNGSAMLQEGPLSPSSSCQGGTGKTIKDSSCVRGWTWLLLTPKGGECTSTWLSLTQPPRTYTSYARGRTGMVPRGGCQAPALPRSGFDTIRPRVAWPHGPQCRCIPASGGAK